MKAGSGKTTLLSGCVSGRGRSQTCPYTSVATRRIKTGDQVRVDGRCGSVEVLEPCDG